MKEAVGGVFVIEIIIIFLLVINGYLAFSVNYTKAFRVKNRIVSIIENHEGLTETAKTDIENMMKQQYYRIDNAYIERCTTLDRGGKYEKITNEAGGFCHYVLKVSESGDAVLDEVYKGTIHGVAVYVNIDLPVINKLLPFLSNFFAIKGETKTIYSSGTYTEL